VTGRDHVFLIGAWLCFFGGFIFWAKGC